jgi:hypothetical protein
MLFSHRNKLKKIKDKLQIKSIDDETRNRLWSGLCLIYWDEIHVDHSSMFGASTFLNSRYYPQQTEYFKKLWVNYFKLPIDTLDRDWQKVYNEIREYFFKCSWHEVFDFIEFLISNFDDNYKKLSFKQFCNGIFKEEFVGYRLIEDHITEITSESEINEIDEAINQPYKPIATHLNRSLELLSDRKNPDYRNSIKESISAVEAFCKIITHNDKATLGDAIKEIETKVNLHPSLKQSILKLYGYTSDEKGIRHSLLDEDKIDFDDAKFMLVSCSSFINYMVSKKV